MAAQAAVSRVRAALGAIGWRRAAVMSTGVLVLLIALAPAQGWEPLLKLRFADQLQCARWSGSFWDARCDGLSVSGDGIAARVNLGDVAWRLRALRPAPWRLEFDFGWRRAQAWLQSRVQVSALDAGAYTLEFFDLRGVASWSTLRNTAPRAVWQRLGEVGDAEGRLVLQFKHLVVPWESPPCGQGSIRIDDLRHPLLPAVVGPLQVDFSGACPLAVGVITDLGGPLHLRLNYQFAEAERLNIVGEIIARPAAAAAWSSLLSRIGPPSVNGGHQVDVSLEWHSGR